MYEWTNIFRANGQKKKKKIYFHEGTKALICNETPLVLEDLTVSIVQNLLHGNYHFGIEAHFHQHVPRRGSYILEIISYLYSMAASPLYISHLADLLPLMLSDSLTQQVRRSAVLTSLIACLFQVSNLYSIEVRQWL